MSSRPPKSGGPDAAECSCQLRGLDIRSRAELVGGDRQPARPEGSQRSVSRAGPADAGYDLERIDVFDLVKQRDERSAGNRTCGFPTASHEQKIDSTPLSGEGEPYRRQAV